jgi:hypothetical protein
MLSRIVSLGLLLTALSLATGCCCRRACRPCCASPCGSCCSSCYSPDFAPPLAPLGPAAEPIGMPRSPSKPY